MTTGTFTQTLTEGLTSQARQLAHLRKIGIAEAWGVVAASCRENIGFGDPEGYWRAALAIAERHRVTESDPRWSP